MDRTILSKEKVNEILGRAEYWREVNGRDSGGSTNVSEVLWSELREVVNSLGLSTLWILETYAKENKELLNENNGRIIS